MNLSDQDFRLSLILPIVYIIRACLHVYGMFISGRAGQSQDCWSRVGVERKHPLSNRVEAELLLCLDITHLSKCWRVVYLPNYCACNLHVWSSKRKNWLIIYTFVQRVLRPLTCLKIFLGTIHVAIFKWTVEWQYIRSVVGSPLLSRFETFLSIESKTPYPLSSYSSFPASPGSHQSAFCL